MDVDSDPSSPGAASSRGPAATPDPRKRRVSVTSAISTTPSSDEAEREVRGAQGLGQDEEVDSDGKRSPGLPGQEQVAIGHAGAGAVGGELDASDVVLDIPEASVGHLVRSVSKASSSGAVVRRPSLKWSDIWGVSLSRHASNEVFVPDQVLDADEAVLQVPRRLWSQASLGRTKSFLGDLEDEDLLRSGAATPCGAPGAGAFTPAGGSTPRPHNAKRRPSSPPVPVRGVLDRSLSQLCAAPDTNDGRLHREFAEVEQIGEGHFSIVFRARNRVDNCLYAVKRTKKIAQGAAQNNIQEAFVLASMALDHEGCANIVRYFSSWFESGQLFIQMELCEGSVRDLMTQRADQRPFDASFHENEIAEVLAHVSSGLCAMHSCGFAHLDIKPDNIMRGRGNGPRAPRWKIGDLGLAVAALGSGCDDVVEGDARYLAREVLRGDLSNLPSADIFSLGAMAYELALNPQSLPGGGEEWHALRNADVDLDDLSWSEGFKTLFMRLVAKNPKDRIAAANLLQHPLIRQIIVPSSPERDDEVRKLQEELQQKRNEAETNAQRALQYKEELDNMRRRLLERPCAGDAGGLAASDGLIKKKAWVQGGFEDDGEGVYHRRGLPRSNSF